MSQPKHPCDCCGHQTLTEPAGRTGQICPVCFWEDSRWPDEDGEAFDGSGVDLETAQNNFAKTGACHEQFADAVRPSVDDESRDPAWQSIAINRPMSCGHSSITPSEACRGTAESHCTRRMRSTIT